MQYSKYGLAKDLYSLYNYLLGFVFKCYLSSLILRVLLAALNIVWLHIVSVFKTIQCSTHLG